MLNIKENSSKSLRSAASALSTIGVIVSGFAGILVGFGAFLLCSIIISELAIIVAIFIGLIVFGVNHYLWNILAALVSGISEIVQYTAESATYLETLTSTQNPACSANEVVEGELDE